MSVETTTAFDLDGVVATQTSSPFPVLGSEIAIVLDVVSAITGTSPTLDLTVEYSANGVTWTAPTVTQAMSQVTTTAAMETKRFSPEGSQVRLVATIGGTGDYEFTANIVHFS
tara:strand:+ start:94 stop:432 length:339 start_codon:yes stop_codon:yes gene_type:complete